MSNARSVLIVTGQYDPVYREFGDCAEQAVEQRPGIAMLHTCELEQDHDGPHEWDPGYECPDDEEAE